MAKNKSSSSTSNTTFTTSTTDNSVQAREGAIVAGTNSNLTINTLDADVAAKAFDTVNATTANALKLGADAIDANASVTGAALGANLDVTEAALNTVAGMAAIGSRNLETVENAASLQLQNNTGLATALAGMVTESKRDQENVTIEKLGRYAAYAVGGIAVVVVLALFLKGKK